PSVQALGHLMLFDYYWALANYPIPPQATSQPQFRPEASPEALLNEGEKALEAALKDQSSDGGLVGRALLGKAYIAEMRASLADRSAGYKSTTQPSLWNAARDRYLAVGSDPKVPTQLQDEARRK